MHVCGPIEKQETPVCREEPEAATQEGVGKQGIGVPERHGSSSDPGLCPLRCSVLLGSYCFCPRYFEWILFPATKEP